MADSVTAGIEKFLEPFREIASPVRWVKPKNIHLTLKFIGDVPDEKYKKIEAALNEPFTEQDVGTFDVILTGCGKFGKGSSLSIFWIGIDPNQPLAGLYHTIENRLAKIGVPKEDRPFNPHITVGRNKRNFNFIPFFDLIDRHRDQRIARFPVTGFQLFKSKLTPDGPIYTILKEIPLNHAEA